MPETGTICASSQVFHCAAMGRRASDVRKDTRPAIRKSSAVHDIPMTISLEETLALLNKWKEESALLAVAGESPFRDALRGIEDRGVRWTMSQSVRVSRIETKDRFVEFEGPTGSLSLSLKRCRGFLYEDHRNAPVENREAAEALTLSALSIFFPTDEAFLVYELQEPLPER